MLSSWPHVPTAVRARLTAPSVRDRWVAAAIVFALDGALFGSWAARIPDVAHRVGADASALGVALLCVSLGALVSMQATGPLCARLGAGRVAATAAAGACATLTLPGLTTSVPTLSAALLLFGACTGMLNVSANAVGVQVEHAAGRPVVPSLHGCFSLGGLAGAGIAALSPASVAVGLHLAVIGVAGLLVTAAIAPVLGRADLVRPADPDPDADPDGVPDRDPTASASSNVRQGVLLLGAIAGCTAVGEGAVTDWGGIYLRESFAAAPTLAAAGYACFCLAMACGRLAGGALLRRFDTTAVLVGGSLLAAGGAVAAAGAPDIAVALFGFALVGLGLANVFPVAIARAGALGGARGVALASTVGYAGLLGGPPLLGFLADAVGLAAGFVAVGALALTAACLSVLAAHHRPAPGVVAVRTRSALDHAAAIGSDWLYRYAASLEQVDRTPALRTPAGPTDRSAPTPRRGGLDALLS